MNRNYQGFNPVRKRVEMQSRINFLTLEINKISGEGHKKYDVVSYKTSQIAGKMHTVKIKTDKGKYFHVKIIQPAPLSGMGWKVVQIRKDVNEYTPF